MIVIQGTLISITISESLLTIMNIEVEMIPDCLYTIEYASRFNFPFFFLFLNRKLEYSALAVK